jgi:hypothetical protein
VAEGVRTALHLRTQYLIAESQMPSIQAAISSGMDAEYRRGYKEGYDCLKASLKQAEAEIERLRKALTCRRCGGSGLHYIVAADATVTCRECEAATIRKELMEGEK